MKFSSKPSSLTVKLVGSLSTLLLSLGFLGSPVSAAERLILRFGPLQQAVTVDELDKFANTGELSENLKPYSFLLTSEVKQILSQHFNIDPLIAEQFLADLFKNGDGDKLLKQINSALPESNPQQLKQALKLLLQQTSQLSLLNFVRVYPQESITVDLSQAANLAVQLNASFLQSQLLAPHLADALKATSPPLISSNFDPSIPGQETIITDTFVLNDTSRQRKITVDIYSAKKTQGPLIVMSHGFAADRKFLRYLARHLASYGLTVVSVDHPGSDIHALVKTATGLRLSQILPSDEFINRPQDISFTLNQLDILNKQDSPLKGKFNTEKVSMIGHSFGGYTALALAGATLDLKNLRRFCDENLPLGRSPADWLQCAAAELPYRERTFKDQRIKQVIAINPIIGQLFGNTLSQVKIPTLILSASDDGITPIISHQLQPFKQLSGEKYLIVALGATHMSVTDISNSDSAMGQNTLVREIMGIEAEPVRHLMKGVSLGFIQQLTPNASQYQPFLTSTYVESLSENKIKFRLTTQLPVSLDIWLNVLSLGTPEITSRPQPLEGFSFSGIKQYFSRAKYLLIKPQYSTQQLDDLFTGLLDTYFHTFDDWS